MSWLYGQTWLWYLLAFVVGVLLAWLFLVLPAQRRLRSAGAGRPTEPAAERAGSVAAAAAATGTDGHDEPGRPAVDDAVTEQIPAVDPALSTLDTSRSRPDGAALAAAAGLGAAGVGAVGLTKGRNASTDDAETTREIPRVTAVDTDSDTTVIPVRPADETRDVDLSSAETTAVIPTVPTTDADATTRTDLPVRSDPAGADLAADGGPSADGATADGPTADTAVDDTTVVGEASPAESTGPASTDTAGTDTAGTAAADTAAADTEAVDTEAATSPDATSTDATSTDAGAGTAAATGLGVAGLAAGGAALATGHSGGDDGPATPADDTSADTAATDDAPAADAVTGADIASTVTAGTDPDSIPTDTATGTATDPDSAVTGSAGVPVAAGAGAGAVAAVATAADDDATGDAPFGPGSRRAAADGTSPDPAYGIKGNVDTMRYHGRTSPYFERTRAAVWFRTGHDAEQAGFVAWNTRGRVPRTPAVPATPQGLLGTPSVDDTPAAADGAPAATGPVTPGRFPGSALPLEGGAAPTPEHTIKGNAQSMLYHGTASPYFGRTKAEVWFTSTDDAEAAGFSNWKRRTP